MGSVSRSFGGFGWLSEIFGGTVIEMEGAVRRVEEGSVADTQKGAMVQTSGTVKKATMIVLRIPQDTTKTRGSNEDFIPWRRGGVGNDEVAGISDFVARCQLLGNGVRIFRIDESTLGDKRTQYEAVLDFPGSEEALLAKGRISESGKVFDFSVFRAEIVIFRCEDKRKRHRLLSCLSTLGVKIAGIPALEYGVIAETIPDPEMIADTIRIIRNVVGESGEVFQVRHEVGEDDVR